jgi:hypothetical protein
MPHIRVPADVTIQVPNGEALPFPFVANFISLVLLNDARFGEDARAVIAAKEIEEAFAHAKPGSVVHLPQDHYDRLRAVCDKPSSPYTPLVMRQAVSYLMAVLYPVAADEVHVNGAQVAAS